MKTDYARSWFRARKRVSKVWTEEQARDAHNNRKMYTVIMGGLEEPHCFVEIRDDFIVVGFLDKHLREYMSYCFYEVEDNLLFLRNVFFRTYNGETDEITKAEAYAFASNGKTRVIVRDIHDQSEQVSDSIQDISKNYSNYPEFGNYIDLIRKER